MLLASAEPLVDAYDLALVDLDGVVYRFGRGGSHADGVSTARAAQGDGPGVRDQQRIA